MRVEWLRRALRDLEEEVAYIALENPEAADRFSEAIFASVDKLKLFPTMGREGRISGTRELTIPDWPYLIPYRVRNNCLQILSVFHTRRSPPSSWQG